MGLPLISCVSKETAVEEKSVALLSWDDFINEVQQLAQSQYLPNWDEIAYTAQLQKLMLRLDVKGPKITSFITSYKNKNANFPEIRHLHREPSFMVSMLEFEAGEKIKLHDHPGMSGVILCLEGRANVQNYTLQEKRSMNNKLLIKQESSLTLTGGDTSFLTSTFGNIHSLQADKFTRMIDVFTPPYNSEREQNSRWFDKDHKYYQGIKGLYEAIEK